MKTYKQGKYVVKEYENGNKYWYLNGNFHREDGPACEYGNGSKEWYLNGKRHRIDGPAIEYSNGDKHWYLNGKRHRVNGPAIEGTNGDKYWFLNGKKIYKFFCIFPYKNWVKIEDLNYSGPYKRHSNCFIELPFEISEHKFVVIG